MAAPLGLPHPQGLGPPHPATDLTPEHRALHDLGAVKSKKFEPAAILRDTPAGRRFEEVYRPLAEQYANCMQIAKLVVQAYMRLKIQRGQVSRFWVWQGRGAGGPGHRPPRVPGLH